jgi:hypothetical protein
MGGGGGGEEEEKGREREEASETERELGGGGSGFVGPCWATVMWRGLTWTPKPGKTRSKPSRGVI